MIDILRDWVARIGNMCYNFSAEVATCGERNMVNTLDLTGIYALVGEGPVITGPVPVSVAASATAYRVMTGPSPFKSPRGLCNG
jgi:hypothetical protein